MTYAGRRIEGTAANGTSFSATGTTMKQAETKTLKVGEKYQIWNKSNSCKTKSSFQGTYSS
jgi:hypothetical protein